MNTNRSIFSVLFDFEFNEFITTKVIKLLYGAGIALAGFLAAVLIFSGFQSGAGVGIVALIISPAIFLLYVVLFRVWLEFVIVVFRIAENTGKMAEKD